MKRTIRQRRAGYFLSVIMAAWGMGCAEPAIAVSNDEGALVAGAKLCTQYLPRHERQYGIPEHLLAAIASTESGRFHRGLGLNLPWPWTINVNGRGYFFDTKEEAVAAVNKLRSEGFQSIDVGCMQVNLRHHPKAFASVEQAFDPAYNVGYAAEFLKRNFAEEGSWRKATGDYHSRTASYGSSYAEQVFSAWGRIAAKVADARAGRPVLNTNYAQNTLPKPQTVGGRPVVMASRMVHPSYHPVHMRSISVTSRDHGVTRTREKGVLVIRPRKDDDMFVQVADNQSSGKPKAVQLTATRTQPEDMLAASPAKVVPVTTAAKGQFEPKAHAVKVESTSHTAAATPAAPTTAMAKNLFTFEN